MTAKAGSQTIASTTAGTALGVGVGALVSRGDVGDLHMLGMLSAFSVLGMGHLVCNYRALCAVSLDTLNQQVCVGIESLVCVHSSRSPLCVSICVSHVGQRAEHVVAHFLDTGCVPSPKHVSHKEVRV
jgi:hypothetical protein